MKKILFLLSFLAVLAASYFTISCKTSQAVDFSAEVKPLINKKCIACHGGVKKQGGFSLLFEEEAKAKLKAGNYAIVPGKPEESSFITRLTSEDPEERMPYKHEALTENEIDLLTRWVKEGAKWGEHWAYLPVEKQAVPTVKGDWAINDIDRFVLAKAEEEGLKVSPKASPEVLARRLSLDLIGLPAPDSIKSEYLKNPTEKNYEKMVDKLLSMPQYGEKWASMWLDLARYADTKGYERDGPRSIWRYRDWLINAFNADMPYNQFITEQLAGDLLPNPTENQYLATAFHRNTMTNDEGGTDNEEFRTAAVLDRVNTTWETLLGTSYSCVQCHSHPYDPFKHDDYYKFMAFFNNTRDADSNGDYPIFRHFNDSLQIKLSALNGWLKTNTSPEKTTEVLHFLKTLQPAINSLETDSFINSELSDTKWLAMRNRGEARLPGFVLKNENSLIFRYRSGLKSGNLKFRLNYTKGEVLGQFNITKPTQSWEITEIPLKKVEGKYDIYLTFESKELTDPLKTGIVFDWFHFTESWPNVASKQSAEAKRNFWGLLNANTETTPIMLENTERMFRQTYFFERGSWLAKSKKVSPDVPASLNKFPASAQKNRLGLAKWMTANDNPLLSRTIINRLFEQVWGVGIVETLEDIGTQGAAPSNQALLDYLSYKLMNEYKWSLKKVLKEMVMSASYRQDSKINAEQLEKDPSNRFMARGPRVRLSAEQVRDQALVAYGMLNAQMFGPPVMPYQPAGVWGSPYDGQKWKISEGNQQYRRAIYTYWKRTSPYPSMTNFDAAGRETCSSRRIITNTPLQALTTLNDSVYIDLFAKFVNKTGIAKPEICITKAYELASGRKINEAKLKVLIKLYDESLKSYKKKKTPEPEKKALILVTNAILNLDEVLTKS
ncbi:DUF1553 domain-containing protein [Lacihabitans lacunae]|uniref:DUF1553 domain-containing protein n=1 Tax=Lacihabitans lacunae TaxID=1028214 RepID=A0ABV7YVE3_9BACT